MSAKNLASLVLAAAQTNPEQPALLYRGVTYTYNHLAEQIQQFSAASVELGLKPGSRVGILLWNQPEFVIAYFGLLHVGVTVLPLNTRLTTEELSVILNDAQASMVVSCVEFLDTLNQLQVESLTGLIIAGCDEATDSLVAKVPVIRFQDFLSQAPVNDQQQPYEVDSKTLATLIYTSGTTGKPKGVMLSHRNIEADAQANVAVIEACAKDRFITISPLFHVFGQTNILVSAMMVGATVVMVRKFSPRSILEAIETYRVTFMAAVPTMYQMMLNQLEQQTYDLSSLRVCHSGAAPMAPTLFHQIEARFQAPVQEGYGLSEASSIVTSNPLKGVRKPGSIGHPLQGVAVKICDESGATVAVGDIGELYVQGPIVMQGYYQRPEATEKVLLPDGWLKTGDMARQDEEGYLYIVDRRDDLINIGGSKVYPREIEETLCRHPAVQSAAVIGVPSELYNEQAKAFVVLHSHQPAPSVSQLQKFCRTHLAEYKVPKCIDFVEEIPQGATGKILRKELRQSF